MGMIEFMKARGKHFPASWENNKVSKNVIVKYYFWYVKI